MKHTAELETMSDEHFAWPPVAEEGLSDLTSPPPKSSGQRVTRIWPTTATMQGHHQCILEKLQHQPRVKYTESECSKPIFPELGNDLNSASEQDTSGANTTQGDHMRVVGATDHHRIYHLQKPGFISIQNREDPDEQYIHPLTKQTAPLTRSYQHQISQSN